MREDFKMELASLPPSASVAVVQFVGSFCPITLGHVQCLEEAKKMLMEPTRMPTDLMSLEDESSSAVPGAPSFEMRRTAPPLCAVIATIRVNSDKHVSEKLCSQGVPFISASDRRHLCNLATEEHSSWIHVVNEDEHFLEALKTRYRHLQFTPWVLNGADDVIKYKKWQHAGPLTPHITMGRPGVPMQELLAHVGPNFIVGPELPNISSSIARTSLARGDYNLVHSLLHPRVIDWCKNKGPWKPAAIPGPAPRPMQPTVASPDTTELQARARYRAPVAAASSPAALAAGNAVVENWTTDAVSAFLLEIELDELVEEFRLQGIDGPVLLDLIAREDLNVIVPNKIHASKVRTSVQRRVGSTVPAASGEGGAGSRSGAAQASYGSSRAQSHGGQPPHRSTQQLITEADEKRKVLGDLQPPHPPSFPLSVI